MINNLDFDKEVLAELLINDIMNQLNVIAPAEEGLELLELIEELSETGSESTKILISLLLGVSGDEVSSHLEELIESIRDE